MISDHELNRYRNHRGELPDVHPLMARVEAEHPDWDFFEICDYVRRLYHASAARTEAKAAAIRAQTREISARTEDVRARRLRRTPREPKRQGTRQYGHINARLAEGEEPSAYDLLSRPGWGGQTSTGFWIKEPKYYSKAARQRDRIQASFNRYLRERGRECVACGEHFKPRTIQQKRCRACIDARKRKDGG